MVRRRRSHFPPRRCRRQGATVKHKQYQDDVWRERKYIVRYKLMHFYLTLLLLYAL